jgi:hypothetical protein
MGIIVLDVEIEIRHGGILNAHLLLLSIRSSLYYELQARFQYEPWSP